MSITSPPTSVAVLDSAVTWMHDRLEDARTTDLAVPTPCRAWHLGRLLGHLDDALVALCEAAEVGHVSLDPLPRRESAALVERVGRRALLAQRAWGARVTSAPIGVGDLRLDRDTVLMIGALEVAVHGWDVSQATGERARLPDELAEQLLEVAQEVVTSDERGQRFAPQLMTSARASAGTRLLAHLGRHG